MIKLLFHLFCSIGLVVFLFFQVPEFNYFDLESIVDWSFLGYAIFAYFLTILVRASRFRYLLSQSISFFQLLAVTGVFVFWGNIIPARVGELTFPFLCKKYLTMETHHSFSALILSKLYDVLALLIFYQIAFFMYDGPPFYLFSPTIFIVLLVAELGLLTLIFFPKSVIFPISSVLRSPIFDKKKLWIDAVCDVVEKESNILRVFVLLIFSMVFLFVNGIFYWMIVKAYGVDLTLEELFMLTFFVAGVCAVPIGVAGFGMLEIGFAGALVFLKIDGDLAVKAGCGFHQIQILSYSFFGFMAYVFLRINKRLSP